RFEAFVNFLICGASLLYTPCLMAILVVQGLVRGLIGHYKCPAHILWSKSFEALGCAGKKENAGAKMFANKVLLVAILLFVVAYARGSDLWMLPCVVLMVSTALEWAFGNCAACTVYGMWFRRFPPS